MEYLRYRIALYACNCAYAFRACNALAECNSIYRSDASIRFAGGRVFPGGDASNDYTQPNGRNVCAFLYPEPIAICARNRLCFWPRTIQGNRSAESGNSLEGVPSCNYSGTVSVYWEIFGAYVFALRAAFAALRSARAASF